MISKKWGKFALPTAFKNLWGMRPREGHVYDKQIRSYAPCWMPVPLAAVKLTTLASVSQ